MMVLEAVKAEGKRRTGTSSGRVSQTVDELAESQYHEPLEVVLVSSGYGVLLGPVGLRG